MKTTYWAVIIERDTGLTNFFPVEGKPYNPDARVVALYNPIPWSFDFPDGARRNGELTWVIDDYYLDPPSLRKSHVGIPELYGTELYGLFSSEKKALDTITSAFASILEDIHAKRRELDTQLKNINTNFDKFWEEYTTS